MREAAAPVECLARATGRAASSAGSAFLPSPVALRSETGKIQDETWEFDDSIQDKQAKLAAIYGQEFATGDGADEEDEEDESRVVSPDVELDDEDAGVAV